MTLRWFLLLLSPFKGDACGRRELRQTLRALHWVRPGTPLAAICQPWPRRRTNVSECRRCLGHHIESWQLANRLESQMRSSLQLSALEVTNLSRRLARPLQPGPLEHFRLRAWEQASTLMALLDEEAQHNRTCLEDLVAETLVHAHARAAELWQVLLDVGNSALPNIFQQPFSQHLPIFRRFPPVHGPALEGHVLDFLGLSTERTVACPEFMPPLLAPSRIFECRYESANRPLRFWPFLDEEYLEWSDVLAVAVGPSLRMAEVGAGPVGLWGVRAAKAFLRAASAHASCEVLLVEPFDRGDGSSLDRHLQVNIPEGRCNITMDTKPVHSGADLKALLAGEPWDLVDIDAQGAEHGMLRGMAGWLAQQVRRLHVSTHTRWIHRDLLRWLREAGWVILAEFQVLSLVQLDHLELGPFVNMDSTLDLMADPQNAGAVFQVASLYNCLQLQEPGSQPEDGITGYADMATQGAVSSMACPAAAVFRNYFLNGGQGHGQQVELMSQVGDLLANKREGYWMVKNGFLLPRPGAKLIDLSERLEGDKILADDVSCRTKVGVHWDTQVVLEDFTQNICQVCCSAPAVAFSKIVKAQHWAPFAVSLLTGAYDATLAAATLLAAQRGQRVRVFLTAVGSGPLGNRPTWIMQSIDRVLDAYRCAPLDVFLVHLARTDRFARLQGGRPEPLRSGRISLDERVANMQKEVGEANMLHKTQRYPMLGSPTAARDNMSLMIAKAFSYFDSNGPLHRREGEADGATGGRRLRRVHPLRGVYRLDPGLRSHDVLARAGCLYICCGRDARWHFARVAFETSREAPEAWQRVLSLARSRESGRRRATARAAMERTVEHVSRVRPQCQPPSHQTLHGVLATRAR
ncbi:unnamed protein product [Effrenium voratum]|nr:unnamed protein product [Effrenium voratum]